MADVWTSANIRKEVARLLEEHADGTAPTVSIGHPVLRMRAQPYNGQVSAQELTGFIGLLKRSNTGVGLAAPQLGIPLQVAVMEDPAQMPPGMSAEQWAQTVTAREITAVPFTPIVNPQYMALSDDVSLFEGCLSMPGYQGVVARPHTIMAEYLTVDLRPVQEEWSGWPARIFAHETDHLAGEMYVDKLVHPRSLTTREMLIEHWKDPTPHRAAEKLGFSMSRK